MLIMLIITSSSTSRTLSQTITACCQTYARRGWQTPGGRCPDRSAADSWQVPAALHALLWVRDSAWRSYLCCLAPPGNPSTICCRAWLSLNGPQRGAAGFSYVCLCMWEPPSGWICLCGCTFLTCCELSGLEPVKADRGWRGGGGGGV